MRLPASVVAVLVAMAPAMRLPAQQYLEPDVRAPGVRVDARALADPAAARALGIALPAEIGTRAHGRQHRTGTLAVLVVLTRFSDSPEPSVAPERVDELLFSGDGAGAGNTLPHYYEEQSGGLFTIAGGVSRWVRTDVALLDAAGSVNGHGWIAPGITAHIVGALAALDPEIDFGQFDNDGPDGIPNSGDDDGFVDALSFKYIEVAGSCGGPGPWPHFGGLLVDGAPYETADRTPSGAPIRVRSYIMDSAVECDGATPQGMQVLAHELGHALGLPDYYRAVDGIEPQHRHWAVGCFDLMAAGSWGCGTEPRPAGGFGPTGLSALSRWQLGWAQLDDVFLADDETFTLEPLATAARGLRVRLSPESHESWIFEYRTRAGYDEPLPAEGVLVYHHDAFSGPRAVDPLLPPPYGYHLVEADGDDALRKVAAEGGNRGVAEDVFARDADGPGGPLHDGSTPSTRDHLGGSSTLEVHEIAVSGGTATIRLSTGEGFRVAARIAPGVAYVLQPYSAEVTFAGGQPPYTLDEVRGGIAADVTVSFSGTTLAVQGIPRQVGAYGVSAWIRDAAGRVVAEAIGVRFLDDPTLTGGVILRAIAGGAALGGGREDYLDRSGNRDGTLDLGDLRAYLQRQPIVP